MEKTKYNKAKKKNILSHAKHKNVLIQVIYLKHQTWKHKPLRGKQEIIFENLESAQFLGQDTNSTDQKLEN